MNPEELLKEGLNQLGFSYTEGQIKAFMTFLSELKKWNRAYNLTALRTDEDIIIKHFLDSVLYLKAISKESFKFQVSSFKLKNLENVIPAEAGIQTSLNLLDSRLHGNDSLEHFRLKIADIGTGAGFPGIPIKIIQPEIHITLIEPSRKKTAFLRHIIRTLKLRRVRVLEKRIETLGESYEKTYDVIVSRATFKIKDFLRKACPYVKGDGVLVLSKGPKISEETKEFKNRGVIREILKFPLVIKLGPTRFSAERNLLILTCEKT